ncbi:disintegrin and metalloproteinase domain-containing protein 10-like [Mustelus asterias]
MKIFTSLLPLIVHAIAIHHSPVAPPELSGARLNPLIKRFEGLSYDRDVIGSQHFQVKRSLHEEEPSIHLRFAAHQTIHLRFTAHQRKFHLRLKRDWSMFTEDFRMKTGSGLESADLSHIYSGDLQGDRGSFCHGSIIDGRFEGFIQTQEGMYYIEPIEQYLQEENLDVHSLIYHQDDIDYSQLQGRGHHCLSEAAERRDQPAFRQEDPPESPLSRSQRSADPFRTTCFLYLHADYWYYKRMGSKERVTAQIASYLKGVNRIYESVDFEGIRHTNFQVMDLLIDSEYNETSPLHTRFISIEKLLELHSSKNWSNYCLSYLLTDRDYSGVLGVAWQGNTGPFGGVCSKHLNTGLVTVQNYGSQLPQRIVQLTLAHELGHSLGSPHDKSEECNPSESASNGGNFLMYPYASDGDEYNNDKLSPCSIRHISNTLLARKELCFQDNVHPICGNQLVEEGEECDVGYNSTDPCCYDLSSHSKDLSCKLKPGKQCSPTQGPCCNSRCELVPPGQRCRIETECAFESHCDGLATTCPDSLPKANYTLCNQGTRLCLNGQCSGSLCTKHNLEQCSIHTQSIEEECQLWCQTPGNPATCSSSSSVLLRQFFNNTLLTLPPGSPCKRKQGYCDMLSVCRLVDDDGPIAKLKNAIFNPEEFEDISDWMKTHSWAILFGILILGGLMSSTVFIFGKRLDSEMAGQETELQTF